MPTLVESRNSASSCSLELQVNKVVASFLIDIGAAVSLISHELWEKLEQKNTGLKLRQTSPVSLLECCWESAVLRWPLLGRDFHQQNRCAVEMGPT